MIYSKDELELLQDEKKYAETFERFDTLIRCNGFDQESGKDLSFKDAMDISSASFMIPRVLTNFVQEGVEPMLIGSQLLQRIDYTPGMQTIYPALDMLEAQEVGDNMSLPIHNIAIGGAQSFGMNVKRHGLALRVNQKFVDQSTYPWLQWWMKLAGHALARHKESYIFSYITQLGIPVFDNDPATRASSFTGVQPAKGITTGRNIKGEFNGSLTMDDIYDMYTTIMLQGYIADTMLVHPLTFLSFVRDPVMREFAMVAGGGSFFQNFSGRADQKAFAGQYNFGGLGQGLGQTGKYTNGKLSGGQQASPAGISQNMTSALVLPSYLGMNFRILVSPFVKFNHINRTSDIMMFDSKNLGALIVAEDPHVNSWTEPQYNVNNIGIEESFGLAILNEAQAIGVAKNVAVKPSELNPVARMVYNVGDPNTPFETKGDIAEYGTTPLDILSR